MSRRGRRWLFCWLYACEGGPIGLVWWALPTLLVEAGLPISKVTTLTAVLALPWALKFLWAPLVDIGRGAGFRAWVLGAQVCMGLALLPLIWVDPLASTGVWMALLVIHAICAATQDVAIDAWVVNVTPQEELGGLSGWMQAGMLTGRGLFSFLPLQFGAGAGWGWRLGIVIGFLWVGALIVWLLPLQAAAGTSRKAAAQFLPHLRDALSHRSTWFGLGFALTAAAAFEAVGVLAGPYLLSLGVSSPQIGAFRGIPVLIATILGSLVGGKCADRLGRRAAATMGLLSFVVPVLALAIVDRAGAVTPPIAMGLLTVLYFCIGLFVAASYALFMEWTDPSLGGTQFSAFMAATNGCEAWSGWAGGWLVARSGYPHAFAALSLVSLASLAWLKFAPRGEREKGALKRQ